MNKISLFKTILENETIARVSLGAGPLIISIGLLSFSEYYILKIVFIVAGAFLLGWASAMTGRSYLTSMRENQPEDKDDLESFRKKIQDEFALRDSKLQKREGELSDRLMVFHEWLEFPQPKDFNENQTEDSQETLKKDKAVAVLIESESERFFESIRKNSYWTNDKLDWPKLREEGETFVKKIAHIYRPDIKRPLLEISPEQLSRAINRASLHLMIVMDELPIDIKSYTIETMSLLIRRSVRAYGAYKAASPYLNYLTRGAYIGRIISSASPVTAGAWWGLTELGRHGTKKVVEHFANRQAIAFLHEIIRVLGYEVAAVYSKQFRYRDANWTYGVELTELMSQFPSSRKSLSASLQELGKLVLRNEYDRIYLYRCLAAHQSAGTKMSQADFLDIQERQSIVQNLEEIYHKVLHGQTDDKFEIWKKGLESRLGVQIQSKIGSKSSSKKTIDSGDLISSLATFFLATRPLQWQDVKPHLLSSQLFHSLDVERAKDLEEVLDSKFEQGARIEFTPPDLDPESQELKPFLEDLANLAVSIPERSIDAEWSTFELAAYYRVEPKAWRIQLEKAYQTEIQKHLHPESPMKSTPGSVARSIMLWINESTGNFFLIPDVSIVDSTGNPVPETGANLVLLGTSDELSIISTGDIPEKLWDAQKDVKTQRIKGYFKEGCQLEGGNFEKSLPAESQAVLLQGVMTTKYEKYFELLLTHKTVNEN